MLYTSLLLVRRPADPAKFNGTVIVEWLNVSYGHDVAVSWTHSIDHLLREGYAYVGVSAQEAGVEGLPVGTP
ncbi:alpha/beta hydrolase domain-containing protein, partial [Bacillus sp. SIMBA_033]|uniref:alpha/beta hydrolase domain-containing protein n=1 Tax=Bacillus sp. SIMBA_033 TaxID=3085776 RepID=UPI003979F317